MDGEICTMMQTAPQVLYSPSGELSIEYTKRGYSKEGRGWEE